MASQVNIHNKRICKHLIHKDSCPECKNLKGKTICVHMKKLTICRKCKGGSVCEHLEVRSRCRECQSLKKAKQKSVKGPKYNINSQKFYSRGKYSINAQYQLPEFQSNSHKRKLDSEPDWTEVKRRKILEVDPSNPTTDVQIDSHEIFMKYYYDLL